MNVGKSKVIKYSRYGNVGTIPTFNYYSKLLEEFCS